MPPARNTGAPRRRASALEKKWRCSGEPDMHAACCRVHVCAPCVLDVRTHMRALSDGCPHARARPTMGFLCSAATHLTRRPPPTYLQEGPARAPLGLLVCDRAEREGQPPGPDVQVGVGAGVWEEVGCGTCGRLHCNSASGTSEAPASSPHNFCPTHVPLRRPPSRRRQAVPPQQRVAPRACAHQAWAGGGAEWGLQLWVRWDFLGSAADRVTCMLGDGGGAAARVNSTLLRCDCCSCCCSSL